MTTYEGTFTIFSCALRMDYDGDYAITFADFVVFAREWLQCDDPCDPACLGSHPRASVQVVVDGTAHNMNLASAPRPPAGTGWTWTGRAPGASTASAPPRPPARPGATPVRAYS